jgi:hypothetical protein|tara:strand:+ start:971 stop:1378 length:408 start_codon:yes stop_codon:yes gene_type:complete
MGYLSIKDLDETKIHIQSSSNYYTLSYTESYVHLSSILLELNNISIVSNNGYYITIKDVKSLNELRKLDNHLIKNINGYKGILQHASNGCYYIYLKNNNYLDNFIKNKATDSRIHINIIKLKKNASHIFPIVYLL